jgi:hypothetical protein
MRRKHSIYVVVAAIAATISVKLAIRPLYYELPVVGFLLGIAPNFISAFALPFLLHCLPAMRIRPVSAMLDVLTPSKLRLCCALGFGLLVINEVFQLASVFGRTFDYYDILFSAFGLAGGYFVFSRMAEWRSMPAWENAGNTFSPDQSSADENSGPKPI